MARLALVDWVVTSTDPDGTVNYRPDIPPAPIGRWACIDLRDYGLNRALVYFPDRTTALPGTGQQRLDLGDRLDEPISNQLANALNARGIAATSGQTLRTVIANFIVSRLQPDRRGNVRAKLFGEHIVGSPPPQGGPR